MRNMDFMAQKQLDRDYLDYNRAKALVKRFYTADQLHGARCSLVYWDLQKKLKEAGESDISNEVFCDAVLDTLPLTIRQYKLRGISSGRVETVHLYELKPMF